MSAGVSQVLEELHIKITPQLSAEGKAALREARDELAALEQRAGITEQMLGTGLSGAFDRMGEAAKDSATGLERIDQELAALESSIEALGAPTQELVEGLSWFSAGSAGLAAVIVGLALLIDAYDQVQQGIAEAVEQAEDAQVKLTRALQQEQQRQNPVGFAAEQLRAALVEQERLVAEIRRLESGEIGINLTNWGDLDRLKANLSEVTAQVRTLQLELNQAARASNADIRDEAYEDPKQATRALEQRREAIRAFKEQLEDLADTATTSQIDNLERAIARLEARARELGVSAASGVAVLRDRLESLRVFDQLGGGIDQAGTFEELETIQQAVRDLRNQGVDVSKVQEAIDRRMLELYQRQTKELAKQTDEALQTGAARAKQTNEERERLEQLRESVREMEEIGRGAIGAAQGMGLLTAQTSALLHNLVTAGSAIQALASGAGGIGAVIGAAGSLVGVIGGLFGGGESPEAQAAREATERNTEVIQRLTIAMGDFTLDITGAQFARVRDFLGPGFRGNPDWIMNEQINRDALGISPQLWEDLKKVADEVGVDLAGSFGQLRDAIRQAELTQFASTFAGQMQALRAEMDLFDLDGPIDQLEALRRLARDKDTGSVVLRRALDGLDLTTTTGRQAAEAAIQELFRQLQSGGFQGRESELGGLTPEQFLQFLTDFERLLDRAEAEGQVGGRTEQFGIDQTITVAQASEILAYLGTANVWAQRTAENTGAMVSLLQNTNQLLAGGGPATATAPATVQDRALAAGNNVIA